MDREGGQEVQEHVDENIHDSPGANQIVAKRSARDRERFRHSENVLTRIKILAILRMPE